jgi:hypothetical protein
MQVGNNVDIKSLREVIHPVARLPSDNDGKVCYSSPPETILLIFL